MIEAIRNKILQNQFEFSQHAVNQSIIRRISVTEIREAIANGEIIEDYPDDKYGSSCLVFGFTIKGRPIHSMFNVAIRLDHRLKLLHYMNPI